ncbi:M55 family metallopeptidase [Pelotomaculum isophthalicicum JI]|uniref:M55 family metallopeptidase n=1 Tax=Pelotomaculum isophthalicicum JI TaxID=947010 RepID=A0A9X4H718_9FIRM|nr:M55 family metallopeptidase [Pelotomaculum isophthalicicum]MDF9409578.1 M55 family metallopeptidase [Pelotomaculum isophthalicicum JI]
MMSYTVFIAADIEGVTGYVSWPDKPPEDYWLREQMTAEVNAAIEGALAGGAGAVIVSDIHWNKKNIIPDKLARQASLIRGGKRKLMWLDSVERSNLAFLIGFHTGCGKENAVLPHTMDTRITSLKINGLAAGEALITAVTAGCFGIPVGLATGDSAFINEIKTILPDVEKVAVKEAIGNCAAINIHPDVALKEIRDSAKIATQRAINGDFQPYRCSSPVEILIEVIWPGYADALCLIPGVIRKGGREVSFTGDWFDAMGIMSLFVNWISDMPGLF